ncbi:antibiotic biosynthesis monooxygenase [Metabacillus idriensis]|uniref:antibiotic biosynthesis monooxygenase family protein n=1 Tax=Metabacillus idriensis TaxID=324768 RepID=UPI0008AA51C6|nr:antibiotic biosynthesis monooxygenase [Metabacillus idriensis]MCM3596007.1 antibiotic biosynthesis monooxygenase [Metabacillus idriensis]OHR73839.1 antibiotic biosynthesis monooxygenase [Bacillus sp. HMSC76G11]
MILEAVLLQVKQGMEKEYEDAFRRASPIISSMKGYISHDLQRCLEVKGKYLLLVKWDSLEDHTIGFRQSPEYQEWKELLHHFYDPFPTVEHFESADLISRK